jgi:hypothetical protein
VRLSRRAEAAQPTTLLLPPSYPLECGWCGQVRTRPLDTACPLCGGAWYRLAVVARQAVDKMARHM